MVKSLNFDFGQVAYYSKGNLTLAKHDTIGKGSSSGAEWGKFQLHCIFQFGVNRPQTMSSISTKHITIIVHGFRPKTEKLTLREHNNHLKGNVKRSRMAQISALQYLPLKSKMTTNNHFKISFQPKIEISTLARNDTIRKGSSREQNEANVSFIAPSSERLKDRKQ